MPVDSEKQRRTEVFLFQRHFLGVVPAADLQDYRIFPGIEKDPDGHPAVVGD